MQIVRRSWHVIETTSLFDNFTSSLDIRGRREHDLYEELLGPQGAQQSLRRFLYDDVKEQTDAAAKVKEKEQLKQRLEAARLKCDEEQGRRSGRLAGQAEDELAQVEEEIQELERKMEGTEVPNPRDYEELSGIELLRKFDSSGRMETRRTREQKATAKARKFPLMPCSKLCATGNIDGTGLVGMLVAKMLEIEELCESLAPWDRKDLSRSSWISSLEEAVHTWNSMSPLEIGTPEPTRSDAASFGGADEDSPSAFDTPRQSRRTSFNGSGSVSKRRKLESPVATLGSSAQSVPSVIALLKRPLLDLEERVADISNLDVATRDAELADENMSMDGSDDDEDEKDRLDKAWKRIVHNIRLTPTTRHVQIRDLVAAAMVAARKAHSPEVVAKLRAAVLAWHPHAAGQCKGAAIKVLEEHGDYDPEDDEDAEDEEGPDEKADKEEEGVPSCLSAEGAILISSLGGSDDASRSDWMKAVKSCRTISRLAALTSGLSEVALEKLKSLEDERDDLIHAVKAWQKEEDRKSKSRPGKKNKSSKKMSGPSEVWANVRFTDEIIMAKAEEWPWWPAKKCQVKDPGLAESLSSLNRCLVALIGEMGGLRVVKTENIRPFTGKTIEDDDSTELDKDVRNQLDDCMTMTRRILRGRQARPMDAIQG